MSCGLSSRQKELYHRLKERISIDDLLKSSLSHSNTASKDSTSTLMNIVMQFRKVREREREGGREGGREGRKEGREGGREEGRERIIIFIFSLQVCNHPELFERRDVLSPISLSIPPLPLPRLLYHYCIRPLNESRQRYMKLFQVFYFNFIVTDC